MKLWRWHHDLLATEQTLSFVLTALITTWLVIVTCRLSLTQLWAAFWQLFPQGQCDL